ncbi:jg18257 [Pararge aegeria aegeria]|uniref:Jg18257 protein n=1 Tax=Pararge aegeria aegeria TaxID=348720 RepID=A0A8S4SJ71_9NEOP|nr:jg18257 [Pararge aegeria aegeria]
MGGAKFLENRTLGSQGAGMTPPEQKAQLVDPQRVGQTTSSKSLGAAGNKRPRTMEFRTLCKRPLSSSVRKLVVYVNDVNEVDSIFHKIIQQWNTEMMLGNRNKQRNYF